MKSTPQAEFNLHRNRGLKARNIAVKFWVNVFELEEIKKRCENASLGSWLRNTALGDESKPTTPRRIVPSKVVTRLSPLGFEVARIGNNLNQIARSTNSDVRTGNSIDCAKILTALIGIRKELARVVEGDEARQ